jgi:ribonuclease D
MQQPHPIPSKDEIALLPEFVRLGPERIRLASTAAQAQLACAQLSQCKALGFDTESKPTFAPGEQSQGPHIVQLASADEAWIFQLHDPACARVVAGFLGQHGTVKAGFGLGDDRKRILHKLGVEPVDVLDLNHTFRDRGYRKDMGVKGAIAVLFGQRFIKSKKAGTSNWANVTLTPAQLMYAANDAYAALRVYQCLHPEKF